MLESRLEAACLRIAKAGGFDFPKLSVGRKGRPDRVLIIPWRPAVYIEFKRPKGRLSPTQIHEHVRLRVLGYRVEVIRTTGEFQNLLNGI